MQVQRTTICQERARRPRSQAICRERAAPRQVGARCLRSLVILSAVLLAASSGAVSLAQESHIGNLTGNAKRGKQLYRRYCEGCHGILGNGQGENAIHLDPRPRDFTAGVYKCRSTPSGSLPYDTDLFETIGRGLHASAMPSWFALTRQERVDLCAFVKAFCPRFREEKPAPPVPIPPETANTSDSIVRGKQLFKKMECWKCHGQEGRGDGPSAPTLTDNKERPIVPYDFTTGERFKCGQTNEDLYRIFMTGLDGTPMPSFQEDLKPDQAWDLVHFLRTLQVSPEKQMSLKQISLRKHTSPKKDEQAMAASHSKKQNQGRNND